MKLEAFTASPDKLVIAIDKAMKDEDLETWKIVKTANDEIRYTHTPPQWDGKALVVRKAEQDRVVFTLNYWTGKPAPSMEEKGVYLGRFTEVLLVHFRNYFNKLEVSV